MLKIAIALAREAHKNQKDKEGIPYIAHPLYLMSKFLDTKLKIIAILHDSIEDSFVTFNYLRELGFSLEVIQALKVLTRLEYQSYDEYIFKIAQNKLACKVKIEDLKHNMDLSRIVNPKQLDFDRVIKYQRALSKLIVADKKYK